MQENLDDLIAIIEAPATEPLEKRLHAISTLANRLAPSGPAEEAAMVLDCLTGRIRLDGDVRLVNHCMGVLSRVKADSVVVLIIDVLLGSHIYLFENEKTLEFLKSDGCLRLRCAAAQALGRLRDDRAIIPLMSILNNKEENYRLRLAVAESLGKIGDSHAVLPLLDILADEREKSVYLKESAVKALGMLGDIRAVEPLIDMLESKRGIRDKFNFLKEQIIEAVGRIGRPNKKATDSLLQALGDEAPSIRLAAVEALGEMGDEACLAAVQKLIFDADDDVAKAAIFATYHIGGEAAIRDILTWENLPRFLRDELESFIP